MTHNISDSDEMAFDDGEIDAEVDDLFEELQEAKTQGKFVQFYLPHTMKDNGDLASASVLAEVEGFERGKSRDLKCILNFVTMHKHRGSRLSGTITVKLKELIHLQPVILNNRRKIKIDEIAQDRRSAISAILAGPETIPVAAPHRAPPAKHATVPIAKPHKAPPSLPNAVSTKDMMESLVSKVEADKDGKILVIKFPLSQLKEGTRTVKGLSYLYCAAQFLERQGDKVKWRFYPLEKRFAQGDQEGTYGAMEGSITPEKLAKYDPELLSVPDRKKNGEEIPVRRRIIRFVEKKLRDVAAAKLDDENDAARGRVSAA